MERASAKPGGRRLSDPPYLQVALDMTSLGELRRVVSALPPRVDRIIVEAGTPLIKRQGAGVVSEVRLQRPDAFVVADLKTLDVGRLEVGIAAEVRADAAAVSGLAPRETVEAFLDECAAWGIVSYVDMMNVADPAALLASLGRKPDVALLHRAIDAELGGRKGSGWEAIPRLRKAGGPAMLVAVAGGITPESAPEALRAGADILVVGRAITGAPDVRGAALTFVRLLESKGR